MLTGLAFGFLVGLTVGFAYARLALALSLASLSAPAATGSHLRMGIDQVRDRVNACAHAVFEDRAAVREWEQLLWRASRA